MSEASKKPKKTPITEVDIMSNPENNFRKLLEKEILLLEDQLRGYESTVEEKTNSLFKTQEEYLAQLLENNVESERKAVYEKTIEKKERDLLSLRETSKKKLESVDEMISKYRHTMSKQGDLREKNVSALKRLIISNELHFGNMRMFRADVKAKRAKIAYEISNARSELAAKKKEFEALGEKLAKIDCPEVSPSVKKEISESCQKILKDGRKRLLTLKMENRTLWMKLNHNV